MDDEEELSREVRRLNALVEKLDGHVQTLTAQITMMLIIRRPPSVDDEDSQGRRLPWLERLVWAVFAVLVWYITEKKLVL